MRYGGGDNGRSDRWSMAAEVSNDMRDPCAIEGDGESASRRLFDFSTTFTDEPKAHHLPNLATGSVTGFGSGQDEEEFELTASDDDEGDHKPCFQVPRGEI